MSFFKTLSEKPWLNNLAVANQQGGSEQAPIAWPAKTALSFFLAVISVIFLLFTITFLSRSQSIDFQALSGEPWLPLTDASLLWLNSGVLLLASVSLQLSVMNCRKKQFNVLLITLFLSYFLTAVFLFGQYQVWQQLASNGYFLATNPANSFYYLLTGIHGLHLLGGALALGRVIWSFWKNSDMNLLHSNLRLCTTYWHYLFIIWLFLFALLTASTETYRTIALFCGF